MQFSEHEVSPYERTYIYARTVAVVLILALVGVSTALYPDLIHTQTALLGAFFVVASTLAVIILRRAVGFDLMRSLLWVVPTDLFAIATLGAGFHEFEDPAYSIFLAFPVVYSLVIRRRQSWVIGLASGAAYLFSHAPFLPNAHPLSIAFLFLKSALIVYLGFLSASIMARQHEREEQISQSTLEKERLNDQLQRRLAELQAISQITEIIHSSLDFDRVGPLVLEVLTKVINVPSCCLFVIDRGKAETIFSASVGMSVDSVPVTPGVTGADMQTGDSPFSCMSVMDHHHMMVVFCADSDVVDALSDEDRLVLQAVASELVVAVENSQLYKLTKRLAITDELTDLYNYRYLQQRLDEEIERARRYHKDLSLIMLDADDFKRFNDTQGHMPGDRALAELGAVMKRSVREVDVVCRYGGEEFAVVLPETDAAGAYVVAEKIREGVSEHLFEDADGERTGHLTVSLGLASFPSHADDKETLLRLADDALYQAKNGGKDRVRSPLSRLTHSQPVTFDEEDA